MSTSAPRFTTWQGSAIIGGSLFCLIFPLVLIFSDTDSPGLMTMVISCFVVFLALLVLFPIWLLFWSCGWFGKLPRAEAQLAELDRQIAEVKLMAEQQERDAAQAVREIEAEIDAEEGPGAGARFVRSVKAELEEGSN